MINPRPPVVSQVAEDNHLEIPAEIAKRFDLKPGAKLEWRIEADKVTLLPLPASVSLRGLLKGRGIDFLQDLLDARREERLNEQ